LRKKEEMPLCVFYYALKAGVAAGVTFFITWHMMAMGV
jgi:hypothetical protein